MKETLTADVFPGQGKSHQGMGEEIYKRHPVVRDVFEIASDRVGKNIARLCFEGPEIELKHGDFAQVAVVTVSFAGLRANEAEGEQDANVVAGHSLGQLTAGAAAGAVDFPDAVTLAFERGRLMKQQAQKEPGFMTAILGLTLDRVERICREAGVEISNINTENQIVIGGRKALMGIASSLANRYRKSRVRVFPVDVGDIASHTSLMRPLESPFTEAVNGVTIKDPRKPLISGLTGKVITSASDFRDDLVAQLYSTINWMKVVQTMVKNGVSEAREIGPGKVLSGLTRENTGDIKTRSQNL